MKRHTLLMFGRLNIIKMTIILKLISMFHASTMKIQDTVFFFVFHIQRKVYMERHNIHLNHFRIAKIILERKKKKMRGITLPNVKYYYTATVIKTEVSVE